MADTVVGIELQVDANPANTSVKSFKTQLKEATQDVITLSEKFGAASTEAQTAAKKVASLKDAIGDAKQLADTFNPDKKFVAFGGAVQGVASGFAGLQGAMALFGSQSQDVEKVLLKVQSAMALQQGISGIAGAIDSFKLLGNTIKTQVVSAFSTLKGAIIATGIGALAVIVGLVIANFDKVKETILNLFPGLGKLASFIGGLVQGFTDFIGVTSQAARNLDALSAKTDRYNEDLQNQMKVLAAAGKDTTELQKKVNENQLNLLRERLKQTGKLSEEEQKQFRDLKTSQVVLDVTANKKIEDANEQRNSKIASQNDAAAEKSKAKREKELAEALAAYDDFEKKRKELSLDTSIISQTDILAEQLEIQKELKDTAAAEDKERVEKQTAFLQGKTGSLVTTIKKEDEARKASVKIANTEVDNKVKLNQVLIGSIGQIADLVGRQTAAGKVLAIAAATIDTYAAIAGQLKAFSGVPVPGFAIAQAIITGVFGLANVLKIINTPIPGVAGGSGGGTAPTIDTSAPVAATATTGFTQLDPTALNAIGNATTRAFVVESDVADSQERITRLNRAARL